MIFFSGGEWSNLAQSIKKIQTFFILTKFSTFFKMSLQEYSLIINKHNQKLISMLENQKIYGGFLKY